jgi:pimeloyl-ACP methyl ester carboxylesterase
MPPSAIKISDYFIESRLGKIFSREWKLSSSTNKEPIILIHDSLGCVELWRDFPSKLCEQSGRNVIAYDRPGFGKSDPRSGSLPLNFVSEESNICLPVIANQFQIREFVLFGHSVGGAMAITAAVKFQTECKAVISESAQAFIEEKTLRAISEAKKGFQESNQISRLKKYHGEKAKWVFDAWTETWLGPDYASWNLKAVLPDVRCQLLVIHGDRDEYGTQKHPEMICEFACGPCQKAILSDCGHIPHREKGGEVVELVSRFVERL